MFLGYFCSLQSASFIFMSHLYSVKKVVHFIYLFIFHLEVYVCVYICAQLSNDVRNIPVKASSVCICMCVCAV